MASKTFDQYVKEYGSVSKALAATGHTQTSSGTWVSAGSNSGSSSSSNSGSQSSSKTSVQNSAAPISTDWQAKINEAVARKDYAAAAQYEQQRNAKIQSANYTGKQTVTNNYSQYLPQSSSATSTTASAVGKTNNAADIQALIAANPDGSAMEAVAAALSARNQKITSNPTVYGKDINGIYVGDDVTQQALNYINGYSNQFLPQIAVANTMGQAITPNLSGTDVLGDLYGITYDQNTIKDILNRATEAEYASKEAEYGTTENKYINQAQTDQATTLNTLQKANQQASVNSSMMGANSANALSAILSGQQLNATNMLDLANQRNLLQSQKTAALSANASTALTDSNSIKQAIANIDLSKYGYDTQKMVGQLDYLAALNDALAQIKSSQTAADATKYASDNDLAGTKYNSDSYSKNTGGGSSYTYNGGSSTGAPKAGDKSVTGPATGTSAGTQTDGTKYTVTSKIGSEPVVAYKNSDGTYSVVTDSNGARNTFTSDQYKIIEKEGSAQAVTDPSGWLQTSAKSVITAPSMDGRGSIAQRAIDNYKAITKAKALSDKSTIICAGKVYKWQPSANAWYLANSNSTTPFTTVFVMQQLNKNLNDSNTKIEL